MNIPYYAKRIAQFISVERWIFEWDSVRSGTELPLYQNFVSSLLLEESSIRPYQRAYLILRLAKKISQILLDCRVHSETMQFELIVQVFISEIEICLDSKP
ncbi:hypothetical protein LCL85_14210 [Vibrio alginolyticus]|nr:hypothetical protein [Vibrio alginolyticus]